MQTSSSSQSHDLDAAHAAHAAVRSAGKSDPRATAETVPHIDEAPPVRPPYWLQPSPPAFVANFFLLMFIGVLLSYWLINYTSYFEFFGSLLALSGLFSWIAVILKIVPDAHARRWRRRAQGILHLPLTEVLLVVIAVLVIVALSSFATVEVRNLSAAPITVRIRGFDPDDPGERQRVPPGESVREVFLTRPFAPTTQAIHVDGYARVNQQVRPWTVEPLIVGAEDFPIRAIRLRPGQMAGATRKQARRLAMRWTDPNGTVRPDLTIDNEWRGREQIIDEMSPAIDDVLQFGSAVTFHAFEKDVSTTKPHPTSDPVEVQSTTQPFLEARFK